MPKQERPDWKTVDAHERDEIVARALDDGHTYSAIASMFENCERQHIGGLVSRLRAKGVITKPVMTQKAAAKRGRSTRKPEAPKAKPVKSSSGRSLVGGGYAASVQKKAAQRAKAPGLEERADRAKAFEPLPGRTPVPLVDLGPEQCRWPVDGIAGKGLLQCGAPCDQAENYCAAHSAIAYTLNQSRGARHVASR